MQTGKVPHDGLPCTRRLLAEYNTDIGLSNYIDYFELKRMVHLLEDHITQSARQGIRLFDSMGNSQMFASNDSISDTATTPLTRLRHREKFEELVETFFVVLRQSYARVKAYLQIADNAAMSKLKRIKATTEEELREKGKDDLGTLFTELQSIAHFRELNCSSFRKIMKKFVARCAANSLELQRKIARIDAVVSHSNIAEPLFDLGAAMDYVVLVFGTCFRMTFEDSLAELKCYAHRYAPARFRIVPMSSTFFFEHKVPHKFRQGSFAVRILSGTTNINVAKMVGQVMRGRVVTEAEVSQFPNGEVTVYLKEAVRGDDCFVIQSMSQTSDGSSSSTAIMELLLLLQTLRLASCERLTAVVPYLAYTTRTAQAAALAEMITLMGCRHVITVDMYREQVEGFFPNVPVENVTAKFEFIRHIVENLRAEGHDFKDIVVISPDSETVARARGFADSFMKYAKLSSEQFVSVASVVQRTSPDRAVTFDVIGNVKGKLCVVVDSAINRGAALLAVTSELVKHGAKRIKAVGTHAVFNSEVAIELANSPIEELIVTDSICHDEDLKNPVVARKLRIIPVAPLLAEAINRVHTENTLSTLFEKQ